MPRKIILIVGVPIVIGLIIFLGWLRTNNPSSQQKFQPSVLKIGFSIDWEYGSRKKLNHKLPIQALTELIKVVEYYNTVFQPDLVIGGGDYIESTTTKADRAKQQLREVVTIFNQLDAPHYYALGNHDMRSLTKAEVMEILGIDDAHTILDQGDWRLVIFDSNFHQQTEADRSAENYTNGYVGKKEMEWLDKVLDTDRPTIVFSHHSPALVKPQSMNYREQEITIHNAAEVRALLERHPNVVASMAGHTPLVQLNEINGIYYFVADTLVNEEALGSFATIEAVWYSNERRAEILFEHYGPRRETYRVSKTLDE